MSTARIAVVGHCAAGKSSVVRLLVEQGYEAYSVAQEHSAVHDLWAHQQPDLVVFLDVSLGAIRERKGNHDWPEWIFEEQSQRLQHAREHADIVIDTDLESVEMVVECILRCIRRYSTR